MKIVKFTKPVLDDFGNECVSVGELFPYGKWVWDYQYFWKEATAADLAAYFKSRDRFEEGDEPFAQAFCEAADIDWDKAGNGAGNPWTPIFDAAEKLGFNIS